TESLAERRRDRRPCGREYLTTFSVLRDLARGSPTVHRQADGTRNHLPSGMTLFLDKSYEYLSTLMRHSIAYSSLPGVVTAYAALGGGLRLHPDHLDDLRRSGLQDATIIDHAFFSLCPRDIPCLLGFNPQTVLSAYLVGPAGFPDGFFRMKVFPSVRN